MENLLDKASALASLRLFIKSRLRFRSLDRKDAVLYIIENTATDVRSEVATEAVEMCLDYFQKTFGRLSFVKNFDVLDLALSISSIMPIAHNTAKLLVEMTAKHGFHGRFPELPEGLLGRKMNESEVVALVSAYVSNTASCCTSTEEKLVIWIEEYLSSEKAEIQIDKILQFRRNWDNEIL